MIEYKNVIKAYGEKTIVNDVSFTAESGEFVVIIGPSGCGKTTTVKMLNQLTDLTGGNILIDGKNIEDFDLVALRTGIGYVIQEIGLFPNMTIEENISVVPSLKKWSKEQIVERVKELMLMVGMPYDEYARKYPKQLSGGQQQRVGVLRALAARPPIIIMDEPFGALDPITREVLQNEVKKIQRELKITVLFITHDMREAVKMADKIIFMNDGCVLQQAPPPEMLAHPADRIVADFMSMQEVSAENIPLKAGDIMRRTTAGKDAAEGVAVDFSCGIDDIYKKYLSSGAERVFVADGEKIVGEITMDSMLAALAAGKKA